MHWNLLHGRSGSNKYWTYTRTGSWKSYVEKNLFLQKRQDVSAKFHNKVIVDMQVEIGKNLHLKRTLSGVQSLSATFPK